MMRMPMVFIRTCQECGNRQPSLPPPKPLQNFYLYKKCVKCKSESLDYGSYVAVVNVTDDDEEP